MTRKEEFSKWLWGKINGAGMRPTDLAKKAKLADAIISRALNAERLPSPDSLRVIASALGIPQKEAFVYAGYMDKEPEYDPEFEEFYFLLSKLPEDEREYQKRTLKLKLEQLERQTSDLSRLAKTATPK